MQLKREYIIIFLIMLTEVLGFSIILPFLPFFAQDLGATPLMVGLIFMSFSLFQFISAPIMGKISDSVGRRPMLMFSQFSTFIGYIILGLAGSLWMIFLSRIIDGLLGSNFTIAQAYISDISSKKDRSKAFSITGAAFGFGFLVGPGVGGFLSQFSYSLPAYIAAGFSFATIILTYFLLPETVKSKKKFRLDLSHIKLTSYKNYFYTKTGLKLWQFLTFVLTHALFVSTYALYAERQLGLNATHVGYMLAYVGLLSIILRTILFPKLVDVLGEVKIQYIGVISLILSMVGMIFVKEVIPFMLVITLFAGGSGLARPVVVANISRSVGKHEQGAIMGVTSSLQSLSQIIAPLVGGLIIQFLIPGSLGVLGAVIMVISLLLLIKDTKIINTH